MQQTGEAMKLSPKSARKHKDILKLNRTMKSTGKSWLHLCHDGKIVIFNHVAGRQATGNITLTRREFEIFARFYERGQKIRKQAE
jgi:hypothetical protein